LPRLRGKGAYTYENPGPVGKAGRAIGSAVGRQYFGPAGEYVGNRLGGYAHYIGRIFGSGDYQISRDSPEANLLMSQPQVPEFSHDMAGDVVTHRAFVCDIFSSGTAQAFQIQNFPINPGMFTLDYWMAKLCNSTFQQYCIEGAVFEFVTRSSDYAAGTTLGYVVMATDYDSSDAPFASKQQMEQTQFVTGMKPSKSGIHWIECKRPQTSVCPLYIRSGAPPPNTDIRLYDLGRFSIATGGVTATNVLLGELWISWKVRFLKTILQPIGSDIPTASVPLALTAPNATPFTLLPGVTYYDTIGLTFGGATLSFPSTLPTGSTFYVKLVQLTNAGGAALATNIGMTPGALMQAMPMFRFDANTYLPNIAVPNPSPPAGVIRSVSFDGFFQYVGGGTPALPPTLTYTPATTPLGSYVQVFLFVTLVSSLIPTHN
jgi:hypothetical protein